MDITISFTNYSIDPTFQHSFSQHFSHSSGNGESMKLKQVTKVINVMHCACVSIQEMQVSDVSDVTFT